MTSNRGDGKMPSSTVSAPNSTPTKTTSPEARRPVASSAPPASAGWSPAGYGAAGAATTVPASSADGVIQIAAMTFR